MKLYGVTLTYNEADIVPYVMEYHKRLGFDKLIVYDNESTDNTVELLSKYPFVEIRTFKTNGQFDDLTHIKVKTDAIIEISKLCEENCWCYVGDFDEVLYYNGDFREYLEELSNNGYNIFNGQLIQPISNEMPKYKKDILLHEHIENSCFWGSMGNKVTLLKLNDIINISFEVGCHHAHIKPNKELKNIKNLSNTIKAIHLKYIGYDRNFEKFKKNSKRLSDTNLKNKWCWEYLVQSELDGFKKMWDERLSNTFKTKDYIEEKIKYNGE